MSSLNAVKRNILASYMKTAAGRAKLAQSMIRPLRSERDYSSVARKAFLVDQLPDGSLPIYDRDPDVVAYVVGEEGENILSVAKPNRVLFPLFEIAANPEIPITQIKERRYDLVTRCQTLAKTKIQEEEDARSFAVMDAAATDPTNPNSDILVSAPMIADILADAFAEVERWDIRVARVFMNARDYADLRKFDRDTLDIESQAVLLRTGLLAVVWGAQIIVTKMVPAGVVYVAGEAELFGRIPVRTELTVLSADDPKNRVLGFSVFENIGIGVHNPKALCRVLVDRS